MATTRYISIDWDTDDFLIAYAGRKKYINVNALCVEILVDWVEQQKAEEAKRALREEKKRKEKIKEHSKKKIVDFIGFKIMKNNERV